MMPRKKKDGPKEKGREESQALSSRKFTQKSPK